MTRNQIDYLNYLEKRRSNQANEQVARDTFEESVRHNKASLSETTRSNKAREAETRRHNLHSEGLTYLSLGETQRHNFAQEQISTYEAHTKRFSAEETQRANLAREEETHRSNVASESIAWANVAVAQKNAETSRLAQAETARHNVVAEKISTHQANTARLNWVVNQQEADTKEYQVKHGVITGYINAGANVLRAGSEFLPW